MKTGKPPGGMSARNACATLVPHRGIEESTGKALPGRTLAERVHWCAGLVADMAEDIVTAHWNAADVDLLATGRDTSGRALPSNAHVALRRLNWDAMAPTGIQVTDRVKRMAQEQAGRILRGTIWRARVVAGILETWPADPGDRTGGEWDAVRAAIPDGARLPSSIIRARTRQIATFRQRCGRTPQHLFDLEPPPSISPVLPLAACDRQQFTLERCDEPNRVLLRVKLPTRPDPRTRRDWTWVAIPLTLPPTVPAHAHLHPPTLHVAADAVRADLTFTHPVPGARKNGHLVALGVDWGLNTLLSAGVCRIDADGHITAAGSGGQFRAAGILAKQHRLRRHGEALHAKAERYRALNGGGARLEAKLAVLAAEIDAVAARRTRLNGALAWAAARWTVDQAVAARATVIYVEDLRSMEARGMGRAVNTRLSQTVRGKILERVRHIAAESGIAVVTVPAKDTSRRCPHCLTVLRHRKAPDRTEAAWKWAVCPGCGFQGDRDQGAWMRIAARGLAHQNTTIVDRAAGTMAVARVKDSLEARAIVAPRVRSDRSKAGPTSKRPTPRRRRAPSPTRVGKRPEGRVHTGRLPRAAGRHQGADTAGFTRLRHQPRGARLGAGFHLHAHATPPRWADPPPDTPSDCGSLN